MGATEIRNTATTRIDDMPSRGAEYRWWAETDPTERAKKISTVAAEMWKQLEPVRASMLMCMRLYGNAPIVGLGPRSYRSQSASSRWNKISLNIAKAIADTYTSMITKDRPKVSFVTNGATHDVQEKAKNCERFCDGIFYENNLHELDNLLVLDTAQFPLSVEHWYADTWSNPKSPKIVCDRRLPWELLIDEAQCQYGRLPREVALVKTLDRWELVEEYKKRGAPEIAKRLETVESIGFDDAQNMGSSTHMAKLADLVTVVEIYRRSRTTESRDGLHCIVVGDVMLNPDDQEWPRTDFPIELNWRLRPSTGIFGSSLVDEIAPIQRAINVLLQKIERSHHLCAVPHLLIERNSQVDTNKLDNQIASNISYTGTAPIPLVFQAVTSDVYQHLWALRDAGFAIIGVNAMNAQGQLPPGVKSGRAMRTLADVTTQRFQPSYRQFQGLYIRRARQVIALAREIAEKHPNFATQATGKAMQADVKWAAANLPDEVFVLQPAPTNALADDPASKIEQVQEIQGLPPQMKRLLNFPDLESDSDYEQANYNLTMRMGDEIINKGEFYGPEPFMNLDPDDPDGSIKWMNRVYLRARMDRVAEDRLEMLRTWMRQAEELFQQAKPKQPTAPAMPGPANGAPMAPGGPPAMPVAA